MYRFNPRRKGKIVLDIMSIFIAFFLANVFRYEMDWSTEYQRNHHMIYTTIFILIYLLMNLQNKSWRYTSILEVSQIIGSNIMAGTLMVVMLNALKDEIVYSTVVFGMLLSTSLQLFNRYVFRMMRYFETANKAGEEGIPTLVIGAGEAGENLAKESRKNKKFHYDILGYIDDNPKKHGIIMHGYRVFGGREMIPQILKKYRIDVVIIAIPSATSREIKEFREYFKGSETKIKVMPSVENTLENKSAANQLRDIKIEDLLGRAEVSINNESLEKLIGNKTVFVTGGAGSIGSELSRQIAKHKPKKLIGIDVNENDLYFLELELKRRYSDLEFICEVCNVREADKVEWLFAKYRPDLVFHAAAHKHVPLMEHNPEEAIKNNIMGTKNVADAAEKYEAERFVLVSTDKAVNPTNIMGATKRACELVIDAKAGKSKTKFMAVRFGNVLGSNGSVIPIFKKLIEEGKNLTLTHKDITRYFMTIPEAAQLVIEAGYLGEGGEVFILDMGEPIKIMDLAKNLIELADSDVSIDIVGLRQGEKLYEELLYDVNAAIKTENKKIFISRLKEEAVDVEAYLSILREKVADPDTKVIKEIMKEFVSTYSEPSHHFVEEKVTQKEEIREVLPEEKVAVVKGKVAIA